MLPHDEEIASIGGIISAQEAGNNAFDSSTRSAVEDIMEDDGGSEWEDDDESQAITRSPDDPALELVWMVCHLREIIPEPPGNLYAMTEKLVYDLETATLGGLEVDKIGIKILEQSVPVIPHDYDLLARIVFILRDSYERLFKAQGDLAHVESAIRWTQYGILTLPKDHLDWLILSSNLGMLFHTRFKLLGNLADINKAIDCLDQVVSLTLDTDEARPSRLRHLGAALCSRFDYLGNPADIDMAIGHQTQALALIGDGHLHKPIWLNQLGIYLQQRCHRLGTRADIERAIEIQSQALALTTGAENEARAEQLRSLADTYDSRFVLLGDLADIHKAIDYFNEALSLVAEGYADTHMYLNGLGRALVRRFNREGNPADIERAIDCHHKAVLRSPNGCLDNACSLASLAASYQYRFERLGNLEDIDKSIDYGLQALSTFPDGHSGKLLELGRVGVVYEARFERLEDLADIDKAIECQTQAISLIPKGHPGMPEYLQALGNSRMLRFQRLGNLADIDLAISLGDEAISLAPHGNHGLPGWLNNLGVSYHVRFNHGGKSEDVDKAIDCFNQASLLLPDDGSAKPSCLSNLGTSYTYRFRRLNNPSDIDSAIEYFSQAVYLTTSENVSLPATLNNLGASYRNRFDLLQERTDIELAIQNLISASKSSVGHPFMKLKASLEWARLSTRYNISSPLEAYQHVMELVPQVGWLGMTVGQRYENIAYNLGNLALEAAASAIEHRSYDLAVEWLDEGRSVVWNQLLQIRTPLDRLSEQHPLLAQELSRVAQELEQISSSEPTDLSLSLYAPVSERLGQRRHRLAEQWERLIDEVRSLPGFQSFLKPKKLAELAIAAQSGPVAIVNVYKNRCDALVLHRDSDLVIHIPLPSFSHTKALEARTQLLGVLSHADVRARGTRRPIFHQDNVEVRFEDVLATLWTGVVRPILDRLGYLTPPTNELSHLTWCATGPLVFLPIHAAGLYNEPGAKIFDYVISSYAPTLGTLIKPPKLSPGPLGILAVGQSVTTGSPPLPGTVAELNQIQEQAELAERIAFTRLDESNATCASVLSAMETNNWVHMACHASQNPSDPTRSAFLLHDGALDLATITQKSIQHGQFAFLSACQTATGDEHLPEEAVHLAAGMLMAGYPSVIATMWSIKDDDAPLIAGRVYADLFQNEGLENRKASQALHAAVKLLRDEVGETQFARWVPYVHIGY